MSEILNFGLFGACEWFFEFWILGENGFVFSADHCFIDGSAAMF